MGQPNTDDKKIEEHQFEHEDGITVMDGTLEHVMIYYRNHRGEEAMREIMPRRMWYGISRYHMDKNGKPEPQYLLRAWDCEKNAWRDFAMRDIISWNHPNKREVASK